MPLLNSIASWLIKKRIHQIELFMKYPHEVQQEWLRKLLASAKDTEWGRKYGYSSVATAGQFRGRVPLQDYETLKPSIERVRRGEQNLLWNSEIRWFAKSSGTTSDKSKFIPVSTESLEECHYKGGKDMVAIHCNNFPETQLFTGKNLALGGSHRVDHFDNYESYHGDVSAIIIQNLPFWAEFLRAANLSIALMDEWEAKLEKLARATMSENITSMAGVPSWMLLLLRHILNITGRKNMLEVWPNLEVYFHGGVNFAPYREQFRTLIPSDKFHCLETYNASEGFFAIQDRSDSDELLLMLDYGIYYEFIPAEEVHSQNPEVLSLDGVEAGKNYALVISTNAGLWRYVIGDTIMFTSTNPYRIHITGRTRHFINAFGEELIIDNAENALRIACEKTGALIREYTAAPVYMNSNGSGAHEWAIEFESAPDNVNFFAEVLDNALKSINSDYEAKRYQNLALKMPVIRTVKSGTFYQWLKTKGKLGGQYKVPRLSNDRKVIEEVLKISA
jgi:hypothetical protein